MTRFTIRLLTVFLPFFLLLAAAGPGRAATDGAAADFTPWSGYWWPTNNGGLATGLDYNGHPAPLEKYDFLTSGYYPGPASQWYLERGYDPSVPAWYGLCWAWAAAAVSEHIDFQPLVLDKLLYNIGDKKGLLTACHEHDETLRANSHDPVVFHNWLLQYIKGEGRAFFAELDPGPEVWNYPVYRYEMTTTENSGILSVAVTIWYADDLVEPDFQGTREKTKSYTYQLNLDGNGFSGGEWTGASAYDHPQQLILPVTAHTDNPNLNCELIRELAATSDDDLESDQAVDLTPGSQMLLLLNEDVYNLPADLGDTVIIRARQDADYDLTQYVHLTVSDRDGTVITDTDLASPIDEMSFTAVTPPYTLRFTADDYRVGNLYYLTYDLKKPYEFTNPKIQKGFTWGGFAITNPSEEETARVQVVGYDESGSPVVTCAGPFDLAPGEKRIVLTEDFELIPPDLEALIGIKVMADRPLKTLNLFGYDNHNLAGYGEARARTRLVIPDTSSSWNYSRSVKWGLYNPELRELVAGLELFTPDGLLIGETNLTIPPNRSLEYDRRSSPFTDEEDGGWVLVNIETPEAQGVQGHTEWLLGGILKAEALGGLAVGTTFFMPQVVSRGAWDERLTLINADSAANLVSLALQEDGTILTAELFLAPHEKRELTLDDIFPGVEPDQLNRCALQLTAEQEIAGYVNFTTPGDELYYPLLDSDDISRELILPHVAANNYWWTGCALFNPFGAPVTVEITPYDQHGLPLPGQTRQRTVNGGSKDIFTIKDLLGREAAAAASFIRFRVITGSGLTGIYAYGNPEGTMLTGAVMR